MEDDALKVKDFYEDSWLVLLHHILEWYEKRREFVDVKDISITGTGRMFNYRGRVYYEELFIEPEE